MTGLIVRLGGIARTWVMVAACSGWSGRARPSTERIAVSRALRVLAAVATFVFEVVEEPGDVASR